MVGLASGACCGGKIIRIGRRKTQLIMNCIGVVGVLMCIIVQNLYMLLLGRVIYGFAVGVTSVGMPRYLDEFVPLRRYSLCIGLYVLAINFGYVFALCGAVLLPPDTETQELIDDNVSWRILLGLPLIWFTVQELGFLFVIKNDGPSFYLGQKDYDGARDSFEKIYKTLGDTSHFDRFVAEFEKSKKMQGSSKVSIQQALCKDENYMRATWVNIADIFFHEMTGINVILQYSNTILENIFGDDTSSGFNARTGTYVISWINFLSAGLAVYTI